MIDPSRDKCVTESDLAEKRLYDMVADLNSWHQRKAIMKQKKTMLIAAGSLLVISQANAFTYYNDFETPVGPEFNLTTTSTFDSSTVLGRFSNGSVQLTLTGLTVGETATVKFDLFVLDSWDGSANNDRLVFDIDGTSLLDSTFSNVIFNAQNYPDPTGGGTYTH
ncbi:MAG TPA: hypothetical protein VK171_03620, partial [Fimbriimonas sp.]|nr:hypothetical protein [Fimbriimonas sp.]